MEHVRLQSHGNALYIAACNFLSPANHPMADLYKEEKPSLGDFCWDLVDYCLELATYASQSQVNDQKDAAKIYNDITNLAEIANTLLVKRNKNDSANLATELRAFVALYTEIYVDISSLLQLQPNIGARSNRATKI